MYTDKAKVYKEKRPDRIKATGTLIFFFFLNFYSSQRRRAFGIPS